MLDWIPELVGGSALSYLVILGFVWLDAWFPVVPGETLIITGAIVAAQGGLSVWLVFLAGFLGAVAGDNFTYLIGDKLGRRAADRLFRGEKSRKRLSWAQRQLRVRTWIVIAARFIPGGRTAVMFASGMLEIDWRWRFLPYEVTGALLWTLLATVLGYFFGSTFEDSIWLPLLVSVAIAGAIAAVAEVVRRTKAEGGGEAGEGADYEKQTESAKGRA